MKMNKVMWFDIPSDNIERSAEFYETLFGWKLLPRQTEEAKPSLDFRPALTIESDNELQPVQAGGINGGIVTRQLGITQPAFLVEVDDIEAKLVAIEQKGGSIITNKTHLKLAGGYFAYFHDPEGNVVGLWEVER